MCEIVTVTGPVKYLQVTVEHSMLVAVGKSLHQLVDKVLKEAKSKRNNSAGCSSVITLTVSVQVVKVQGAM